MEIANFALSATKDLGKSGQQLQKKPIVLLDDIFDKLDDSRVRQLVQLVTQGHFGQLFITDTHKERTEAVGQQIGLPYEMIEVKGEPQE